MSHTIRAAFVAAAVFGIVFLKRSVIDYRSEHDFSTRDPSFFASAHAMADPLPIEGNAVNNLDGLVAMTTSYYHYDYPKRNVDFTVLLFPSLNDWGRVRANAQVKLKQEIVRDFFASISAYNIYDSRPVIEDANLNDFGVTFSIGWTF